MVSYSVTTFETISWSAFCWYVGAVGRVNDAATRALTDLYSHSLANSCYNKPPSYYDVVV